MTDIVQALRQGSLSKDDYRWEAADEIERLRAEVKTWVNHTKNAVWSDSEECKLLTAEVEKLRAALDEAAFDMRMSLQIDKQTTAEIERLRAALEFYSNPDNWKSSGWDHQFRMMSPEPVYIDKGDKARAALEGKHD